MEMESMTTYTTLNKIRAKGPCAEGWTKLLRHLGKTQADDEPLALVTVLKSNGIADAIWTLRACDGIEKEARLYAVWCARQVQHLMTDPRSLTALDVAERHAHGEATDAELAAARAEARAAAGDAVRGEARGASEAASWAASEDASGAASWAAAWAEARAAQAVEFRRRFG